MKTHHPVYSRHGPDHTACGRLLAWGPLVTDDRANVTCGLCLAQLKRWEKRKKDKETKIT